MICRNILILSILFLLVYGAYLWTTSANSEKTQNSVIIQGTPSQSSLKMNIENVVERDCNIPERTEKNCEKSVDSSLNMISVIGISVFLILLALHALFDVVRQIEENQARQRENLDGNRRKSLAEFANEKPLRRDSRKSALCLFQTFKFTSDTETMTENSRPLQSLVPKESNETNNQDTITQLGIAKEAGELKPLKSQSSKITGMLNFNTFL